jgi:hypothetical protein
MTLFKRIKPGDWVIYRRTRRKNRPSAKARDISPTAHGDGYCYVVDKFRKVQSITEDGKVILLTPKGKTHVCDVNSPALVRAGWLTCILQYRHFRKICL